MQEADEVQCRIAIIHRQSTPHPHHTNLFLGGGINLARHDTLEGRNTLATVSLLSKTECLFRR